MFLLHWKTHWERTTTLHWFWTRIANWNLGCVVNPLSILLVLVRKWGRLIKDKGMTRWVWGCIGRFVVCIDLRGMRNDISRYLMESGRATIAWLRFGRIRLVATPTKFETNWPEMVIVDCRKKEWFMVDFSVPFDPNVAKKEEEKRCKYRDLATEVARMKAARWCR